MGRAGPHALPALGALSDPCAGLTQADLDRLRVAARILAGQRNLAPRVGAWLGGQAERVLRRFGAGWQQRVQALVEEALWRAHDVAVFGLDPQATRRPWSLVSRAASTLSGAATGFAGLPGVAVDIPVSTFLILRSIAEIARAEGEDIGTEEGKRACLEVLALGGPGMPADTTGDQAEVGYWTARIGLGALGTGALVPQAARLLGLALSEKLLAQAVPMAGAAAGAGLNYLFISYYQDMARVHFAIRAVERAHPDLAVRECLHRMVDDARAGR